METGTATFKRLSWAVARAAVAVAIALSFSAARGQDAALLEKIEQMENGLRPALRAAGATPQRWTLESRMRHHKVPGVSIAIIHDGKLAYAKGYGEIEIGSGEVVTTDTVFSVGSLSKVGAAITTLRLVAEAALDLDADIDGYTERWKLPGSSLRDGRPVTLRGLLSHTAGLSVHGFADFQPNEDVPTLVQILGSDGPAKNAKVELVYAPGESSAYSGGGTTLAELVVEDVTGMSFPEAAQAKLFEPLGMDRSTYVNPLPAEHGDIARAHDENGLLTAKPRGWHTFAERAASGLWTTPSDYARMVVALMDSYHGRGSFLPPPIAIDALTEVGASQYGLGPKLEGIGLDRRFMHGGANESYKAFFQVYVERGEGLVVFTNGANGGSLHAEIRRAAADTFAWPDDKQLTMIPPERMAQTLDGFVGKYVAVEPAHLAGQRGLFSGPLEYRVKQDEKGLSMVAVYLADGERTEERRIPLYPVAPLVFADEDASFTVEFVRDTYNMPAEFVLREDSNAAGFVHVDY